MIFNIRNTDGNYIDVNVTFEHTKVDIGMLNNTEARELASVLIHAASELTYFTDPNGSLDKTLDVAVELIDTE